MNLPLHHERDFTWTQDPIDWTEVDALEVSGVIDDGDACVALRDATTRPHFWSVYVIRAGIADCVADRNTRFLALEWAEDVAAALDITIRDYTYPEAT